MGSPMTDTVAGRSSGGGEADRNAAFSQTQASHNPQYPPQAFQILQNAFMQGTPKSSSSGSNVKQPTQLIQ